MNLLNRYLGRTEFADYDDFAENCKLKVPDKFNFAYDVVDEYARICPEKRALVWCNDKGESKTFSFGDISKLSNKIANMLLSYGYKKGDIIMSMLNRRWEFWVLIMACHKIGAVLIPATYMLTPKDISYRINGAGAKVLVSINEDSVI